MKFWQEIVLGLVVGGFLGVIYLSAPVYGEMISERAVPVEESPKTEPVKDVGKVDMETPKQEAQKETAPAPVATAQPQKSSTISAGLKTIVEKALVGSRKDDDFGIVIRNFKTGESFSLNDNKKFTAASLYKLWVMGETFRQVENGSISLDDKMSSSIEALNQTFQIASESAELTEGGITLTVSQALEKMITVSDNYSAMLLIKKLKLSKVRQFMKDTGLTQSTFVDSPETTAADTTLFWEKLYGGKIVDATSSASMMEILKRQQLNYILPKYLPKGTAVAHKTGEIGSLQHNAGIIFSPQGDYVIVLMSDTKFKAQSEIREKLAKLSKGIYDYFQVTH